MSMAGNVHCTVLYFCIDNDIPQNKAIALLNELVEDMDGDPDNYDFSGWVASEYSRLQKSRPTPRAVDGKTGFCQCDTGYPIAIHPVCGICGLPRH